MLCSQEARYNQYELEKTLSSTDGLRNNKRKPIGRHKTDLHTHFENVLALHRKSKTLPWSTYLCAVLLWLNLWPLQKTGSIFFAISMHSITFYDDLFIVTTILEALLDRTQKMPFYKTLWPTGFRFCCQQSEK